MVMKMAFVAALAAIGNFLGMVLAYVLAALTAGGVLLLFVCIIAEKDREKGETADGK